MIAPYGSATGMHIGTDVALQRKRGGTCCRTYQMHCVCVPAVEKCSILDLPLCLLLPPITADIDMIGAVAQPGQQRQFLWKGCVDTLCGRMHTLTAAHGQVLGAVAQLGVQPSFKERWQLLLVTLVQTWWISIGLITTSDTMKKARVTRHDHHLRARIPTPARAHQFR